MKKIIIRIVAILVLLVVIGMLAALFFLDSIIKKGVETVGPSITKVPVTVESVHISILGASGKVKGLVIGNPEGFTAPNAISVGVSALSLKLTSVLSDKVVVKSIEVREPEITVEATPNGILKGESNLGKILKNLDSGSEGTKEPATQTTSAKPAKKLQVDDFIISGAKVHGKISGLAEFTLPIPEIHLTDLGTGPDGITGAELTKVVLNKVITAATKVVGDYVAKNANEMIQKEGGKILDNATEKLNEGLGNLLKKK